MPGLCVGEQRGIAAETYIVHALPGVGYVARGTPGVGIHRLAPLPHVGHSVLAQTVEDVTGLCTKALLHVQIGTHVTGHRLVVLLGGMLTSIAAPIIFQVVDTPAVIGLGILHLVVQAAQISAAGAVARR